ncbi:hypothetical protein EAE99_006281 [Botrytis elliptica]|nr:hypothetical protein EAE99_006281 [Botrytis elliptica]
MEESADGGEGVMGDGIEGGEMVVSGVSGISGGNTLTHNPLGNLGSRVGEVGLGSAWRREQTSPFHGGALGIFGQHKSQGLRGEKDRKRRWEFQIYEDPVDGKPEGSETAEMREMRRRRQAGERWAMERASGGPRARECAGENQENQENEERERRRPTRQAGDVRESGNDEVDEYDGPQPAEPHSNRSALPPPPPPTQSRIPLAPLSRLPKPKECTPITLSIHWNPEPLIPAAYIERTTRMCAIVCASRSSLFHLSNPGDGDEDEDEGNLFKEAENLPAEDERNRKEEDPAQTRAATLNDPLIEISSTTALENLPKMNLTTLHPSFPTHLQFSDLYGNSDSSSTATNSEGIQEILQFLHEREGRDELIVEYLLL